MIAYVTAGEEETGWQYGSDKEGPTTPQKLLHKLCLLTAQYKTHGKEASDTW